MFAVRRYFINGLLILLPGVITIYVLVFGLVTVDSIFGNVIKRLLGYHVPGAGSILTILLIFATGVFTTNVIGRRIFAWAESLLLGIPIFKNIYQGVEQIVKAFASSTDAERFQRVVLVEYPRPGLYALAFVTNEGIPEFDAKIKTHSTTVFVPTTPNPTSGVCLVVPTEDCIPLDMSIEEAFKTIISAGIISPAKKLPEKPQV